MKEYLELLKLPKTGRSPGSDRCTNAFYKEFRYVVILSRAFNEILQSGSWPDTWNSTIITVIPKEGKDPNKMFIVEINITLKCKSKAIYINIYSKQTFTYYLK